jgi:hypothetical protein
MAVGIPLPELDVTKPAPAPPPDALSEFQRAASLQTAAAQQQAILAQAQGQQQQNQMQALQLKDEQLRRQLAPQFVQKDSSGKPIGFDTEGLYNAMLAGGADPMSITGMRMKQIELQKSLIGLSDSALAHQDKVNGELYNSLESIRDINKKTQPSATPASGPPPASPVNSLGPPVPGTGGMPAGMLPNMPGAQTPQPVSTPSGAAPPGTPQSMGTPEPGEAPTGSESAITQAANAPKPISNEAQQAYQKELIRLAHLGIPIDKMKPFLSSEADLDQAEAELGLHKEALNNAKELAATQEAAGKGAESQAAAAKANVIPFPEMGGVYHVDTGQFQTVNGGMTSPAMLESKYVMDQAAKQRTGVSPDPQFDKGYEKFKTMVPQFNINMAASGGGLGPSAAGGAGGGGTGPATRDQIPAAIRGRVEAALDYRQPLPPAGRNNPVNNAISEWVYKVDPQHDETNFPARNKMMTAMTSGPEATQINAINTALGHVGVLNDAIDALGNSDGGVKALRNIANKVGVQVGDTPVTTLNTIVHRVGPELSAAYIQGGGGEGERGTTAADFDPALGNKQLKDNVAVTTQLLRSKIGSIENQYKNTMGRDDFQQRFITPEARGTLEKLSPQGGGGASNPSGKSVSLAAAKQLPSMQGKTDEQIKALIQAQGHTVAP